MAPALSDLERSLLGRGMQLVETHISRVFLGEHDVYKFKRPVNLGFLDFTSSASRRAACEAEVTLNRRLAPHVYQGVLAGYLNERGEAMLVPPHAVPAGVNCEWAVHMRRLSDDVRADVLLARGELGATDVERIADLLVAFHLAARSDAQIAQFGTPAVIQRNVEENFQQVAHSIARYLSVDEAARLFDFQRGFLRERREVLEERIRAGRIRDGHGDLRLEHLYREASGAFLAIDCIEFNERFRFADVCADLAFLAMDLAYHERVDLAELLVMRYAREAADYGLYRVLDFYQSYRAVVRAKISSLLASDLGVSEATRERAAHEARRYYLLALAAAQRPLAPVRIIATAGAIASGKSTLAESLSRTLLAPVLSADRTRKELLKVALTEAHHDPSFQGAYGEEATARVYRELLTRATLVLESGRSVILDASFRAREHRALVSELGKRLGIPVLFVECACPREVAMQRLHARAQGPSISDGRAEIYDAFLARFEPLDELLPSQRVRVDTTQGCDASTREVLNALPNS